MDYPAASGQGFLKIKATDFTDNIDFNICAICVIWQKHKNEASRN